MQENGPTDEALMERYLGGESSAFAVLLDRYGQRIYAFIMRNVGSEQTAEELVQDVFLRVVHRASTFRRQAKFSTWLYTIARNICIDHARKAKHRRHLSLDAPLRSDEADGGTMLDRVSDHSPGADVQTRDERFRRALKNALARLPEDQRDVFVMREFEGLKFREIAVIVGIPENTVKSRMRYALQALRGELAAFQETL